MNVVAMAVITALIFAEKAFPWGVRVAQIAAAALVLYDAEQKQDDEGQPAAAEAVQAMLDAHPHAPPNPSRHDVMMKVSGTSICTPTLEV